MRQTTPKGSPPHEGPADAALNEALEWVYAAARRLAAESDRELKRKGLGRVHLRILFAVGRAAGLSVGDLRRRLGITRQALHEPVSTLLAEGFLSRADDSRNRRVKRLTLTAKGAALEARLTGLQRAELARAFAEAGSGSEPGWRKVMLALVGVAKSTDDPL